MRFSNLGSICAILLLTTIGCSSNSVPGDAQRVGGTEARPTFAALQPGQVYVREAGSDRVIYSTQVDRGDQVEVDAAAGRVYISGKHNLQTAIPPAASYRLYFRPASKREYHPTMNP
jgi:hypothetical protein